MDVNCLKSTEVEYEIKIRGVTPSGELDFKRKTLRGLLTQERGNRSFFTIVNPFVFSEDEKDARESLADLKQAINEVVVPVAASARKRICSRLTHLSGRIHRLNAENVDQRGIVVALTEELLILEADFEEKVKPPTSTPHDQQAFQFGMGDPQLSPISPRRFTTTVKPILPYKWGLSFTGSNSQESVISFLEKVESLRVSRGVSKHPKSL
ncbi:hypothetical protein QE152_g9416 [Popillia japonica]|uniref:Uncharacterized protein n=1 Tax=Popillia japonica TaxID=7064 RepID=A0AAW1LZM4_POPJA